MRILRAMSNVAATAKVPATALCSALICLTSAELSTNAAQQPSFDVVSVKPNVSGDERSASYVQPGGRYTASNATVRMLIKTAYGVHDDTAVADVPGISLATAIQEQLGLKLESRRAPIDVLVIASVERPMPD
jgi:hypothetical protein